MLAERSESEEFRDNNRKSLESIISKLQRTHSEQLQQLSFAESEIDRMKANVSELELNLKIVSEREARLIAELNEQNNAIHKEGGESSKVIAALQQVL